MVIKLTMMVPIVIIFFFIFNKVLFWFINDTTEIMICDSSRKNIINKN